MEELEFVIQGRWEDSLGPQHTRFLAIWRQSNPSKFQLANIHFVAKFKDEVNFRIRVFRDQNEGVGICGSRAMGRLPGTPTYSFLSFLAAIFPFQNAKRENAS